ncbi:hypothetical protein GIB67_006441 [Kingdonia uniflora]|uniref:Dof zinc finger protein n=1 Tax=Kingdonia uniflora TaxID=39325 RepID=A0A7J7NE96_9MAGN|nr:hypothetical protein GIB67_006441 [Kingdonia uniflora]
MMSPDTVKSLSKDTQTSSAGARKPTLLKPPEQTLNCPRCESPNTKFCYYNNYSLSQPRYFCKTCRRYWTKGGALRNVPIGGGCRKNKKSKSSSRLSSDDSSKGGDSSTSSDIAAGFKFFHGLSPAMELQLGRLPFSSRVLSSSTYDNDQFHVPSNTSAALAPSFNHMGFNNYPVLRQGENPIGFNGGGGVQEIGSLTMSSMESLSSMNQDLHWKLQQQRLAMLFNGGGGEENHDQAEHHISVVGSRQVSKPQAISFGNQGMSKEEGKRAGSGDNSGATEWFLHSNNSDNNESGNDNVMNNWTNGYHQVWTRDLQQYNALSQ